MHGVGKWSAAAAANGVSDSDPGPFGRQQCVCVCARVNVLAHILLWLAARTSGAVAPTAARVLGE